MVDLMGLTLEESLKESKLKSSPKDTEDAPKLPLYSVDYRDKAKVGKCHAQ